MLLGDPLVHILVMRQRLPWNLLVAIVVHLPRFYYFLKLTETFTRHEDQVGAHHMPEVELLRVTMRYVLDGTLCQHEILVGVERRQETEAILTEGLYDLFQMLRFEVVECLRFN